MKLSTSATLGHASASLSILSKVGSGYGIWVEVEILYCTANLGTFSNPLLSALHATLGQLHNLNMYGFGGSRHVSYPYEAGIQEHMTGTACDHSDPNVCSQQLG